MSLLHRCGGELLHRTRCVIISSFSSLLTCGGNLGHKQTASRERRGSLLQDLSIFLKRLRGPGQLHECRWRTIPGYKMGTRGGPRRWRSEGSLLLFRFFHCLLLEHLSLIHDGRFLLSRFEKCGGLIRGIPVLGGIVPNLPRLKLTLGRLEGRRGGCGVGSSGRGGRRIRFRGAAPPSAHRSGLRSNSSVLV